MSRNIHKDNKKEQILKKREKQKSLKADEITVKMVNDTKEIGILKKWATTIGGIPKVQEYKLVDINMLKRKIISRISPSSISSLAQDDVYVDDRDASSYDQKVSAIVGTTNISTLKDWAEEMGIGNLDSYNSNNITSLKDVMIRRLTLQSQEEQSLMATDFENIRQRLLANRKSKKTVSAVKSYPEDLTADMILAVSPDKFGLLKEWSIDLGVKNLNMYKIDDIDTLKAKMIQMLEIIKAGEKEEDYESKDITEAAEYDAISKFIVSYNKNPDNANSKDVFGSLGLEFMKLFSELDSDGTNMAKELFARNFKDVTRVNKESNPLEYIKLFIEDRKIVKTPSMVVQHYLTFYIRNVRDNKYEKEMNALTEDELFPQEFLEEFNSLPESNRFTFASMYIHKYGLNPVDAIRLYKSTIGKDRRLFDKDSESIEAKIAQLKAPRIPISGEIPYSKLTKEDMTSINKCVKKYELERWIIKPLSNFPQEYLDQTVYGMDDWWSPSDKFYVAMCSNYTYVNVYDKNGAIMEKSIVHMKVLKNSMETDISFEVMVKKKNLEIVELYPVELNRKLLSLQTDNAFYKIDPYTILNVPLYQVDERYTNAPMEILRKITNGNQNMFAKEMIEFKKANRTSPLVKYYMEFVLIFVCLFPNKIRRTFDIADKLYSGYITPTAFMNMSLSQKMPECDVDELYKLVRKYGIEIALYITSSAKYDPSGFPLLNITEKVCKPMKCLDESVYKPQDLVIYKSQCYVLPDLIRNFTNDTPDYKIPFEEEEDITYPIMKKLKNHILATEIGSSIKESDKIEARQVVFYQALKEGNYDVGLNDKISSAIIPLLSKSADDILKAKVKVLIEDDSDTKLSQLIEYYKSDDISELSIFGKRHGVYIREGMTLERIVFDIIKKNIIGETLEDGRTLESYGIKEGDTIYL